MQVPFTGVLSWTSSAWTDFCPSLLVPRTKAHSFSFSADDVTVTLFTICALLLTMTVDDPVWVLTKRVEPLLLLIVPIAKPAPAGRLGLPPAPPPPARGPPVAGRSAQEDVIEIRVAVIFVPLFVPDAETQAPFFRLESDPVLCSFIVVFEPTDTLDLPVGLNGVETVNVERLTATIGPERNAGEEAAPAAVASVEPTATTVAPANAMRLVFITLIPAIRPKSGLKPPPGMRKVSRGSELRSVARCAFTLAAVHATPPRQLR